MIGLSALTYDLSGSLYITEGDVVRNNTRTGNVNRRATRVATIDGGASLYDAGHSSSDRSIKIAVQPSFNRLDDLRSLVKNYEKVTVTTDEGAYLANPNSLTQSTGAWLLTLLVVGDA